MLTQLQIKNIENVAKDVLIEAYGSSSTINDVMPPIDLDKISQLYKVTIKAGKFEEDNISGMYEVANNTIYLDETESDPRKRFTVAHEVGHIALHKNTKQYRVFYRTQAARLFEEEVAEEQEANWFAASLLMPAPTVTKLWQIYKQVEPVARAFNVTNSAAYFRLRNLNVVE